ncbi:MULTISPECIES: hypothetical protein [Streptomyces]|uniref:Lipoprotein n=1 Tax=Streptomyces lonegramiae TaxID=3075524 RepID=A0ABU2XJU9_9ACTN|nr:hypothetical protein [Streptomyces sp. DSM 41529]MDT0546203.1 hypothetical protein [Streptomyces sp. DSM 41529]
MSKSVSRVVLAVTAVAALGLVTACSGDSDGDKKSDKSSEQTAGKTPGGDKAVAAPLAKADLEKAVIVKADVKGFEVEKMTDKEYADGGAAKAAKAECQPLAQMMGAEQNPVPKASAYATFASGTPGGDDADLGLTGMIRVSSYAEAGAEQTISDLRGALTACAGGFKATDGSGDKADVSKVETLTAPKLGDEALAYTVTDKQEGAAVKFTVVRSGTHLSVFFGVNIANPAKSEIPEAVVSAQVAKLEKALKA